MFPFEYRAIDPMALILSDEAYLIWVELHHPHEPALPKVVDVVKSLNDKEKKFALARATALVAYGNAVVDALRGGVNKQESSRAANPRIEGTSRLRRSALHAHR